LNAAINDLVISLQRSTFSIENTLLPDAVICWPSIKQ